MSEKQTLAIEQFVAILEEQRAKVKTDLKTLMSELEIDLGVIKTGKEKISEKEFLLAEIDKTIKIYELE